MGFIFCNSFKYFYLSAKLQIKLVCGDGGEKKKPDKPAFSEKTKPKND
jgi:hypothetical protein